MMIKKIIRNDLRDVEYKKDFCWACNKGLYCKTHNKARTIKGAKLGDY